MWPPDHPQASRLESELFLSACERIASLLFWQIQVVMNTVQEMLLLLLQKESTVCQKQTKRQKHYI